MKPLVTICCATYNHEKFIEKTINKFLAQKTTFQYEIIIHDDASTDSTKEILNAYKTLYPDKIKLIIQKENTLEKTGLYPMLPIIKAASGKYLAWCDGDDYWCDVNKLQIQADFLNANPIFAGCYHQCITHNCKTEKLKPRGAKSDFSQEKLLEYYLYGSGINMCTQMWRNYYSKETEKYFDGLIGDYMYVTLNGIFGSCKYLDNIKPSIYRLMHGGNSWSNLSEAEQKIKINLMHEKSNIMLNKRITK